MHIKKNIWEVNSNLIDLDATDIIIIKSSHPILGKIAKDILLEKKEFKFITYLASELSSDWINNELKTPNLFGNTESYFVHFSESLNKQAAAELEQVEDLLLDNRLLFLNFEKDHALIKKINKKDKVFSLDVMTPAFWDYDKLLNYFINKFNLKLELDVKNFIFEQLEEDISSYYNFINLLSVQNKDHYTKEDITSVLKDNKDNKFELAEYLSQKKFKLFYEKLIKKDFNYEQHRFIFNFLISHFIKLGDPSYTQKKKKLTQYDKKILNWEKYWEVSDIEKVISKLSLFEIAAKQKDLQLSQLLKSNFVRFLN